MMIQMKLVIDDDAGIEMSGLFLSQSANHRVKIADLVPNKGQL